MNFHELALKRESCRNYDGRPVSHELLCEILETARLSPSACNSQPWKLILAENEVAEKLRPLVSENGRNTFCHNVPAFVAICETKATLKPGVTGDPQRYAQMDVGMVTMMLTLAAADKGVGSCILGTFNQEKTKELLNIPEDVTVRLVIALGYSADESPRKKIRKPEEAVVGFGSF